MYACHVCSKYLAEYDTINYGYTLEGDIQNNIPTKLRTSLSTKSDKLELGPSIQIR